MKEFIITTDNGANFSPYFLEKYKFESMKLHVFLDNEPYFNQNYDEFYRSMKTGLQVSTSQPSCDEISSFWINFLNKGLDIIHLAISSSISGTYENCKIVARDLQNKYPKQKITVIDSKSASAGQGLLCITAAEMKNHGNSYDDIVLFIENNCKKIIHLFSVNDLFYLRRSGRLTKMAAIVGTSLGIKPLLSLNEKGKIELFGKVRGKKQALKMLVNQINTNLDHIQNKFITVAHANCIDDANYISDLIKNIYHYDVYICEISQLIGAHVGQGTIHIAYWGTSRNNF